MDMCRAISSKWYRGLYKGTQDTASFAQRGATGIETHNLRVSEPLNAMEDAP